MSSTSINEESNKCFLTIGECPQRPLDSDCCGNGCVPCVFDLYEEELKIWENESCKLTSGLQETSKASSQYIQNYASKI